MSTLTNVQNSLFVPNLGPLINRNQTYTLSPPRYESDETTTTDEGEEELPEKHDVRPSLERPLTSLSAVLEEQDTRFAVLPEGSNLEGWTPRDIEELNDHVRHMLHSRRSKFKRSMKGFGKYVRKRKETLFSLHQMPTAHFLQLSVSLSLSMQCQSPLLVSLGYSSSLVWRDCCLIFDGLY